MRKHDTSASRNFCKVIAGNTALQKLNDLLAKPAYSKAGIFILTDSNTTLHCLPVFDHAVKTEERSKIIEIPAGEESKDLSVCEGLWQSLASLGADRNSVLINLGGGVISDIGGFVASTYMRGIRYINVPTSLTGMVDAAIGGKTAIDVNGLKNLAGTFHPPDVTVIHAPFLNTLPEHQLLSGYAEMLKHALIADEGLWKLLKTKQPGKITNWAALTNRCAAIKTAVVEQDPFEKNIRSVLNFGHTIGHAIEALSLKKKKQVLLHGEAVAIGMICESWLSHKILGLHEDSLADICTAIRDIFGWRPLPGKPSELIAMMRSDKKNKDSNIMFTLLANIGLAVILQPCTEDIIAESMEFYRNLKD